MSFSRGFIRVKFKFPYFIFLIDDDGFGNGMATFILNLSMRGIY